MKVLVILVDGFGAFRCGHVRNPSALRRAVFLETGEAQIVYLGAAMSTVPTAELLTRLKTRVLPRFAASASLRDDAWFQLCVEMERLRLPIIMAVKKRLRALCGLTQLRALLHSRAGEAERHV